VTTQLRVNFYSRDPLRRSRPSTRRRKIDRRGYGGSSWASIHTVTCQIGSKAKGGQGYILYESELLPLTKEAVAGLETCAPTFLCQCVTLTGRRRKGDRDVQLRALHEAGLSVDVLAVEFGISRRSVFRVLQSAQQRPRPAPRAPYAPTTAGATASPTANGRRPNFKDDRSYGDAAALLDPSLTG
jgi:hypothetical protein